MTKLQLEDFPDGCNGAIQASKAHRNAIYYLHESTKITLKDGEYVIKAKSPDPNYGKTKMVELPADAPTDRWLDAGDAMEKGAIDDNAVYCIRIKGAAMPTFVYGHDLVNQFTFTLDMVQGIKPYSWILNLKSDEAQADAKRFADVKTWEGGE